MTCANPLPIGCEIHKMRLVIGLTITRQMDLGFALYWRVEFGLWDWLMIGLGLAEWRGLAMWIGAGLVSDWKWTVWIFLRRDTSVGPNRGLVPPLVTGLSTWIDLWLTLDLPPIGATCANPPSIECEIHGVVLSNPMLGDGLSVWQLDWTFGNVRVNFRRGCFALALDWRSSGWIYAWVTVDWYNSQCEEVRERVG